MAKVFVSAIALWDQIPQLLSIAVSVESEDGKPISGLSKSSFTVGQIPSSGGGSWFKQKISENLSAA